MKLFAVLPLLALCFSCRSTPPIVDESAIIMEDDYGLTRQPEIYSDDVQRFEKTKEDLKKDVPFYTSFPIAFSVEGAGSDYSHTPAEAQTVGSSRIFLRLKDCDLSILTGNVQAQRFLFTGEWIKYKEKIPSQSVSALKRGMELYLQFSSELKVEIMPQNFESCAKLLKGKKTFLGRYHLNGSKMEFLFEGISNKPSVEEALAVEDGERLYLVWHKAWGIPVLRNDLDFSPVAYSPIFKGNFSEKGFYYLTFSPHLQLQNFNKRHIRLPLVRQALP